MEKKKYETPNIEIINYTKEEVITTSGEIDALDFHHIGE